ncbi:hypothetical protein N7E02_27500 [Aliirhizobium terrae]|uniref:hypothetical protein n=1 Tax=Terrirhizobium terrae TaxID=2926709 RepID=UPI002575420F|nr:hypothetical protein [Rhizobium sp. CC-CFT758]WJH40286.1 hypothetical protein N7E02_27500 [Rhizobium sp. CC-CFT758]
MVRVFSFAALIALVSADAAEAQTSRPSGQNRVMIVYTNPSLNGVAKHESFPPRRLASPAPRVKFAATQPCETSY